MPLAPSFEQDDHSIDVADDPRAEELHQAIRNAWNSSTREDVQSIAPTDE